MMATEIFCLAGIKQVFANGKSVPGVRFPAKDSLSKRGVSDTMHTFLRDPPPFWTIAVPRGKALEYRKCHLKT